MPASFGLNTLAYVAALVLVWPIKGQFRPAPRAAQSWRAELAEAFSYLRAAPLLRALAWITGFWNLLFNMVFIALVLHVQENLGLEAWGYGLVGGVLFSLLFITCILSSTF